MPYAVRNEDGVFRVYDQSGVKVAESPTREAAEASAKVLEDAERGRPIEPPRQIMLREPDDAGT